MRVAAGQKSGCVCTGAKRFAREPLRCRVLSQTDAARGRHDREKARLRADNGAGAVAYTGAIRRTHTVSVGNGAEEVVHTPALHPGEERRKESVVVAGMFLDELGGLRDHCENVGGILQTGGVDAGKETALKPRNVPRGELVEGDRLDVGTAESAVTTTHCFDAGLNAFFHVGLHDVVDTVRHGCYRSSNRKLFTDFFFYLIISLPRTQENFFDFAPPCP